MEEQLNKPQSYSQDLLTFLQGSGFILVGMGFRLVLLFVTEVIAARYLMPDRYGLITWGLFVINIVSMVTCFGLNTAIRKFLPVYEMKKDLNSIRGLIRLSVFLTFLGGLLGGVLIYFGAGWIAQSVMGDEREALVLLALAFALPFWNLQKSMLAVFGGFKLPQFKVLIEDLLAPFGFLMVVVLAMVMGWKEVPIAIGYFIVYLVSAVVSIVVVQSLTPYQETKKVLPQYNFRSTLKFSWPLILTEPLGKITGLIDIVIIGILATSLEVGIFRSASDMAVVMSLVLMCFGFMYLPTVSKFIARGEMGNWRDLNARTARWSMIINFPLFATLFFFPSEVISIVYGVEYVEAVPVLRILAVAYYGHAMVGFTGMNLIAAGMTGIQLTAHLVSLFINLIGNIILIPLYGLQGAAVASLMGLASSNGICLTVMKWKLGFHPFKRMYFESLGLLLLLGSLSAIVIKASPLPSGLLSVIIFLLSFVIIAIPFVRSGYLVDSTDALLIRTFLKSPAS